MGLDWKKRNRLQKKRVKITQNWLAAVSLLLEHQYDRSRGAMRSSSVFRLFRM